jgi:hypothetical protein
MGEQLAQLQQDLRDARRREAEATERAAHSAEEAEKLERELSVANSKASALQAAHSKLQDKVGGRWVAGLVRYNTAVMNATLARLAVSSRTREAGAPHGLHHVFIVPPWPPPLPCASTGGGACAQRGRPHQPAVGAAQQRGSTQERACTGAVPGLLSTGQPSRCAKGQETCWTARADLCRRRYPALCLLQKLDEHQQLMDVIAELQRQKAVLEGGTHTASPGNSEFVLLIVALPTLRPAWLQLPAAWDDVCPSDPRARNAGGETRVFDGAGRAAGGARPGTRADGGPNGRAAAQPGPPHRWAAPGGGSNWNGA